jgi:ribonucleoside-triphosphate reductase (formate)
MSDHRPSVRAQIIARRTYNRPLDDAGTRFETWSQTIGRVVNHQRWLWERAQGGSTTPVQEAELEELRALMLARKALPAGRTLWLGGTDLVRRREASQFNCSFLCVRTVHDVVDAFWLLLQGCGVGFEPVIGTLSGFTRRMEVEVVRSTRADRGGRETNREAYDPESRTWTVSVGDSAEAWAKSVGKFVAGKFPARKLVLDLSEVRPAGTRLRGYGWICCGDANLAVALATIAGIMNRRAGKLLTKSDIWDLVNWLGTVLSNRRSAQIGLIEHGDPEWRDVARRKPPGFDSGPDWFRGQSNNSVVFHDRPDRRSLRDLFDQMVANGGSEPGIVNMA